MAKKSTGRPVGRPVGTRTSTVELETLSFKVPAEFKAQLQAYAKQRRQSISELIREGVEWRIGEGNTGNTEKVEMGVEFLHGMLSALVDEVRQLRGSVQALEQRLGEIGSMHAPSVTGNTNLVSVDGDIPAASMKAQMAGAGSVQTSSVTGNTDIPSAAGDTPTVMAEVPSASEQPSAGIVPEFDPAKYALGPLCEKGHDADGQGHSIRQLGGKHECRECKNMRSRAYKERQRQAQLISG